MTLAQLLTYIAILPAVMFAATVLLWIVRGRR